MTKRLTQLEQLNKALRLEVKEKGLQLNTVNKENEMLRMSTSENTLKEIEDIVQERDMYRKKCQEME